MDNTEFRKLINKIATKLETQYGISSKTLESFRKISLTENQITNEEMEKVMSELSDLLSEYYIEPSNQSNLKKLLDGFAKWQAEIAKGKTANYKKLVDLREKVVKIEEDIKKGEIYNMVENTVISICAENIDDTIEAVNNYVKIHENDFIDDQGELIMKGLKTLEIIKDGLDGLSDINSVNAMNCQNELFQAIRDWLKDVDHISPETNKNLERASRTILRKWGETRRPKVEKTDYSSKVNTYNNSGVTYATVYYFWGKHNRQVTYLNRDVCYFKEHNQIACKKRQNLKNIDINKKLYDETCKRAIELKKKFANGMSPKDPYAMIEANDIKDNLTKAQNNLAKAMALDKELRKSSIYVLEDRLGTLLEDLDEAKDNPLRLHILLNGFDMDTLSTFLRGGITSSADVEKITESLILHIDANNEEVKRYESVGNSLVSFENYLKKEKQEEISLSPEVPEEKPKVDEPNAIDILDGLDIPGMNPPTEQPIDEPEVNEPSPYTDETTLG